jgi:hypothetical protein
MVVGTVALLIAHAADVITFMADMRFINLRYELNPLVRFAYSEAGLFGMIVLKVLLCAYIVWAIATMTTSGRIRVAMFILAIGLGFAGAGLNIWSLGNFWSMHTAAAALVTASP